jgi:excisionase family DNA binding protein
MEKRLLNVSEAAEYLGIEEKTLYNWVSLRKIPHVKLGHKLLRFDVNELEGWIEGNTVKTADNIDFMENKVYNLIKENGNGSVQE